MGGRVTDASGGAVPGAQVSVRSTNTGTERQVRTNDSGLYTVPLPQPGLYDVQEFAVWIEADLVEESL